jgi:hypothetical protein
VKRPHSTTQQSLLHPPFQILLPTPAPHRPTYHSPTRTLDLRTRPPAQKPRLHLLRPQVPRKHLIPPPLRLLIRQVYIIPLPKPLYLNHPERTTKSHYNSVPSRCFDRDRPSHVAVELLEEEGRSGSFSALTDCQADLMLSSRPDYMNLGCNLLTQTDRPTAIAQLEWQKYETQYHKPGLG